MRIVRELDAGPVGGVERVPIDVLDTAGKVEEKLSRAAIPLVSRALPQLAAGTLEFIPQDPSKATFCRRHEKSDGVLDFSSPARVLAARINGLNPWPSATAEIGGSQIKLGLADWLDSSGCAAPGTVLGSDSHGLLIAAGSGTLRLRRLQRPGGRMLGAAEFVRGYNVPTGSVIPSHPMPALVSAAPFRR